MSIFVHLLQALVGVLWCVPIWLSFGALGNIKRGHGTREDVRAAFRIFYAITQVGFSIRWFLWPKAMDEMVTSELMSWSGLYLISGILAVGLSFFITLGRD